jgi:hypothetical protein
MENLIFVIMPFSATSTCTEAQWTEIFENIFCPAAEEVGYSCERAAPTTGSLTASIVEKLHNAPIVLADVTDRNANVFYELGIRHALSKRTIVTTQDGSHIPSDLKGYWYLTYGIRPAAVTAFKRSLATLIGQIEANPERSDSPVADYLGRARHEVFSFVAKENLKKLNALCTELTGNIIALDRKEPGLLMTDCLQLLLQTLYVDPGPATLKQAYELCYDLRHLSKVNVVDTDLWSAESFKQKASDLLEELSSLRRTLATGKFSEPADPSYMVWSTVNHSGRSRTNRGRGSVKERPFSPNFTVNAMCESALPPPPQGVLQCVFSGARSFEVPSDLDLVQDDKERPTRPLKRTPDGAA